MKKLLLTLLLLLTTSVANAWNYSDWDYIDWDNENGRASTYYTVSDQEDVIYSFRSIGTEIASSRNGTQRIYFEYNLLGEVLTACTQNSIKGKQTDIWKINGQNVKMSYWCKKIDSQPRIEATPYSDAGLNYVINEFKKSPDYVWISNGDFNIKISAKGFTEAWNNAGGDAL